MLTHNTGLLELWSDHRKISKKGSLATAQVEKITEEQIRNCQKGRGSARC